MRAVPKSGAFPPSKPVTIMCVSSVTANRIRWRLLTGGCVNNEASLTTLEIVLFFWFFCNVLRLFSLFAYFWTLDFLHFEQVSYFAGGYFYNVFGELAEFVGGLVELVNCRSEVFSHFVVEF